jgi:F-type H+-transporting ATPase subunit b
MLIDWFTVAAQLANFMILVWLLRRFLYQPVLKAIDEREKRIAAELEHASSVEREASKKHDEWSRKNADFDKAQGDMLRNARVEAEQQKSELLAQAKQEYADLQLRLQETLRKEEHEWQQETIHRIRSEVFSTAGKVIEQLADSTLENRMVTVFCSRLQSSDREQLENMASALHGATAKTVIVRSSFQLSSDQRKMIEEALLNALSASLKPIFEISDQMGIGLELCINGNCLAWKVSTALNELERSSEESATPETGKL